MVLSSVLITVFIVADFTVLLLSVTPPPYRFQLPSNSSFDSAAIQRTRKFIARTQSPYPFIASENRTMDAFFEGGNFDQRLSYETKLSGAPARHPNAIPTPRGSSKGNKKNQKGSKKTQISDRPIFSSIPSSTPVFIRGTEMTTFGKFTEGTSPSKYKVTMPPEVLKSGSSTTVSSVNESNPLHLSFVAPQTPVRQNDTETHGSNEMAENNLVYLAIKNSVSEEKNRLTEVSGSERKANNIDLLTPQTRVNTAPNLVIKSSIDVGDLSSDSDSAKFNRPEEISSQDASRDSKYNREYIQKSLNLFGELKVLLGYILARRHNLNVPSHDEQNRTVSNNPPQNMYAKNSSDVEIPFGVIKTDDYSPTKIKTDPNDFKTVQANILLIDFLSYLSSCLNNHNRSSVGNFDVAFCTHSAVIRMLNEVLSVDKINLTRGVAFIKQEDTLQDDKSLTEDGVELENVVLLRDGLTAMIDRIGKFFRLYTLDFSLKDLELDTEGRGHHHYRRVFPIIVTTYMIMSTFLIPLGFQFMAMLGGKALVLSKLAFIWSMMGAPRRIFSYPYPETYGGAGHHDFPQPPPAYYRAAAHRKDTLR